MRSGLAVGETVILLHPVLHLVGVSIAMERGRQQNGSLADGYSGRARAAEDQGCGKHRGGHHGPLPERGPGRHWRQKEHQRLVDWARAALLRPPSAIRDCDSLSGRRLLPVQAARGR